MLTRTMKRAAVTAAVATLGVVGVGSAAGAHAPDTYVVKPGDTLSRIAPSNWRAVAEANDIPNPDLIFPGQVLRLDVPAGGSGGGAPAAPAPEAPAPAPQPEPQQAAPASSGGGTVWDRLAECESGGNWSINTGNGYYGGLQFSQSSWNAAGGSGNPANASRAEQIRVAENLLDMQGWGAWPACSAKLGLR
ncbi:MAG TPA: transglycosylase family protein [Acidimicrobiales bacterium]